MVRNPRSKTNQGRSGPWSEDECLLAIWTYQLLDEHPRLNKTALYKVVAHSIHRTEDAVALKVQNVSACDQRPRNEKPVGPMPHKQGKLLDLFQAYWPRRAELEPIAERILASTTTEQLWTDQIQHDTTALKAIRGLIASAAQQEHAAALEARARAEEAYLRLAVDHNLRVCSGRGLREEEIQWVEAADVGLKDRVLFAYLTSPGHVTFRDIEGMALGKKGSGYDAWRVVDYYAPVPAQGDMSGSALEEVHAYVRQLLSGDGYRRTANAQFTNHGQLRIPAAESPDRSGADFGEAHPQEITSLARTLDSLRRKGTERPLGQGAIRVGQDALRDLVFRIYGSCCALCETRERSQLITSHIVGWAEDETTRLDPTNAILLCRLHDGLFDKGLIGFTDDMHLIISGHWNANASPALVRALDGLSFRPPVQFAPNPQYLARHREQHRLDAERRDDTNAVG